MPLVGGGGVAGRSLPVEALTRALAAGRWNVRALANRRQKTLRVRDAACKFGVGGLEARRRHAGRSPACIDAS